ncbi:winged helix-turn-helix domain-containing protein [Acidisoma silvae]|uniref:Response regulator transcription factor n=1 Tax=Acidisoma silvae TaxID=2802396 RepID=A0A963YS71_9PROT|nr:response regulator transcription factor [Acidisoma silvae]MCB8876049.1 response regulator transcription factor [Acidisoma silvae]
MRVLVVEDDEETASFVLRGLREHGHQADHAADGQDGLFQATNAAYDVMVVDRMLPGMEGLNLVRAVRRAHVQTPVLFLTALRGVGDRVQGLEAGGDDYLVKPFAFAELLARLQALARRPPLKNAPTSFRVADLELDLLRRSVSRAGQRVDLQPREFLLLEFLMRHADRVVTRTMLLEGVWEFHFDPKTNIVESHMSRLRSKISHLGRHPELIHTVRGSGYVLRAPGP